MMRNVPKPRSDPTLNHLHDSGVAVDLAGAAAAGAAAAVGGSSSIVVHNGRRYRKRRDRNTRHRYKLLTSATSPRTSSTSSSSLSDGAGDAAEDRRCLRGCCPFSSTSPPDRLDLRWLPGLGLACLALCLCAGLLTLQLSTAGRVADLAGRCLSAEHRLSGLDEETQALHGRLAACRANATSLAESGDRLRRVVGNVERRVSELYAARAGLAQVGPLREKVRKLVQDSADRGAAVAKLERRLRRLRAALLPTRPTQNQPRG